MVQAVFVDANVFYSRTLRDWLFLLRQETRGDLFTLATSWDVISEATSRLRDHYPEAQGQLVSRLMEKIQAFVDEIVTDYPGGAVPFIHDEGDWHVHHAATACGARYLLAQDKDFDDVHCTYELYTCDEFFSLINKNMPQAVQNIARLQSLHWAQKKNSKPLDTALISAGCPQFATIIKNHLQALALER